MVERIALFAILLVSCGQFVSGQEPEPTPTPYLGRRETEIEKTRRLDRAHERLARQTYSNLYGQGAYANSPRFNREWRAAMVALYRKLDAQETANLEPSVLHRQKYSDLLNEKNTGLFKLIPEFGCGEDERVVDASPDCSKYQFPGTGSSYSFRLGSHRLRRLADVTYIETSLIARGVFSGAIFVELGDVPIEEVHLNTPGLRYLAEYLPVDTATEAMEAAKRFANGVSRDGFIYGRGVFVTEGNTFAMRSIAYRGKYLRSEAGVIYNELDFDKRRDVIVAFRIVGVEDDGAATIVWRILRDTKSPKLKTPK
ncbi:MAG: hypothetical protein OEQ28_03310 [Acidobacteriota bacterium]|nr:hypothetical protein [Acidobacteriota bacterium]